MLSPMLRPKSCQLFLAQEKLVVLRDDFLIGDLRVGNNDEAEVLVLTFGQSNQGSVQNDASVGEAILRAFRKVILIASLPERAPDYVPSYVAATGFRDFEAFGDFCSSCGCIENQDKVLIFPITYEAVQKEFRQDRTRQVSSAIDPVVLGQNVLTMLAKF